MVGQEEIEEPSEELEERYEHFHNVVDKGHAIVRIDKYLAGCMGDVSRNRIQSAADAGSILVNGKSVKSNYKVKPGDEISLVLSYPPNEYTIVPQDIEIEVVYEDAELMVINKQAGLVVHPGFGNFDGTLLNAVAWHLKDEPTFDINDPSVGWCIELIRTRRGCCL